jgi:hypothetical protein
MPQPELNPYASSSLSPESVSTAHETLGALRGPSTGIIVTAVFGLIAGLDLMSMYAGLWMGRSGPQSQNGASSGQSILSGIAMGLALTTLSLFHIYGATCMRRGWNYRIAMVCAILCCVPALSPAIYFGIPFGIWALVMLRRPNVRAAFAAQASTRH